MRSHALLVLLAFSLLAPPAMAAGTPFGLELGRYHALIITNQNYEQLPPLKTPHADAEALAAVLREDYGFKLTLLRDANRAATLDALDRLVEKLTPNDNLLIFYAGHGHLDSATGEGYWLPVTANPRRRSEWISNSDIADTLRATSAKHVLVIADSCFSGTLTRSAGAGLNVGSDKAAYFEKLATKRSRTSLSSGGLEPVDDGGGGGHSVFAGALIAALQGNNEPLFEGESLYSKIKRPVALNSSAVQKPQYSDVRETGHEDGDFLFYKRNLRPQPRPAATVPAFGQAAPAAIDSKVAYELTFWDSIKDSKDARDFQAYLQTYPQGQFASLARLRVRQLNQPDQPPEISPPPVAVAAAPARQPARISQPKTPPLAGQASTVLIVRATPDLEYAPEFTSVQAYSKAVARLVRDYYAGKEMVSIIDPQATRPVIQDGRDYQQSRLLCQQYAARRLLTVELNMRRDIEELTRTPDAVYFGLYDCMTNTRVIKSYTLEFKPDDAFTYQLSLKGNLGQYDSAFSPLGQGN